MHAMHAIATAVLLHGMMMRLSTLQLYMCGDQALLVLRMHTIYFIQLKLSLYELLIDIRVHFVRVVATTEPMAIHPRYRGTAQARSDNGRPAPAGTGGTPTVKQAAGYSYGPAAARWASFLSRFSCARAFYNCSWPYMACDCLVHTVRV